MQAIGNQIIIPYWKKLMPKLSASKEHWWQRSITMTEKSFLSNIQATNDLARGYGPRPQKRKCTGRGLALVVLLLAAAGAAYTTPTDQFFNTQPR